ncbi:MAG TPA: molybdopterin cofactor-binding domain-containing protein [Aliidongia sp.]|nr:molybdopterin cofactor-binding domain-containing protein [Aliidongia sp.]
MSPFPDPSRRAVLRGVAGGFTLAFLVSRPTKAWAMISARPQPEDAAAAAADGNPAFAPNAFIRIDPTGPVRLVMPNAEMGQGIYTAEATLLAEELDLGLDQIAIEHAPPGEALYATPLLFQQATGGSTSIRSNWLILREAGAVARAMLVSAAAERWKVDPASCTAARGVVTHAASNRSASYGELAAAAQRQKVPDKIALKEVKDFKLIGKPLRRLDTAAKVDGSMQFGIDVRVPDMLIAAIVTCATVGGKVKSVDDRAARAVPGVKDVIKLDDCVAVTGAHFWAAKTGMEALEIDWDLGPNVTFSTDSLFKAMDETSRTGKVLVARQVGDINQTGKKIEATYQLPMLAHAPMEPLNAVVHVRPDACEIWVGTQVPTRCVAVAAKITGLPPEKIIVHNQYLGGGFGRRLEPDSVALAVRIAKEVPYPVKMVWTREHDIQHDVPRPGYLDHISATVNADGMPVAWTDRVTGASVAARWVPQALRADGFDQDTTEGADDPPYDLPNLKSEWAPFQMPEALPIGWWRGVGPTHNLFKVESFLDELAHAAGKDPVEYRRALLQKNPRALGVLNLAAEKIGWGSPLGLRMGRGVALGSPFGSHICAIVETEVTPQGEVRMRRAVAAVDCGFVINPNIVDAQIQGGLIFGWTGALYSRLTYERGAAQQSNFNDYRIMRLNETPPIEVHIVASGEKPGGIGEVGTAIAAPALANAIFAATGIRLRSLPIDRTQLQQDKSAAKAVISSVPVPEARP